MEAKTVCKNPQNEFEKDMDKNISQQQLIPDVYEIALEMCHWLRHFHWTVLFWKMSTS